MEYTQSNLPRIVESYLLLKQSVTSTRLQAERAYNSFRTIDDEFSLTGSRILEIGAGGRGSLLKMFDETNDVVGIDKYLGTLDQGYWKALKTVIRKSLFDPLFYYHLKKSNGGYLNKKRKVVMMDAMDMEFGGDEFDFVCSRFLLEHIEDIRGLAEEVYRVLKPGGVTYHVFALYTTLDGAHTLDWKRYQPWQHLTGNVEGNAYVNKLRLEDYGSIFKSIFGAENVEIRTKINESSREYLSEGLRSKLLDYSDEELLTSSPVIVATKARSDSDMLDPVDCV